MSSLTPEQQSSSAAAIAHYTRRAPSYDTGDGGWHITFAQEEVEALSVQPGARCLDLACGTGLVTSRLASAAGSTGQVIGIDITPAMLDLARARPADSGAAPIEYLESDITALDTILSVQGVLSQYGGFDIIICSSALVILADPASAIKSWATLLKPGGKFLTDVPTEKNTLQHLFSFKLRDAMGMRNDFNRSWVRDIHSLEQLCERAGLKVVRSWRTGNLVAGHTREEWKTEDGEKVFEVQVAKYGEFMDLEGEGRREELKEKFLKMWREECGRGGGVFRDGHWVYVTVAEKM